MKILLLLFMSEIKIDLTLKRSNFLFLLCFKIATNIVYKSAHFEYGIYKPREVEHPIKKRVRMRTSFFI